MAEATGQGGSVEGQDPGHGGSLLAGRLIGRRGFVGALRAPVVAAPAGCLGGERDRRTTATTLNSSPVTTTGAADVEILLARMVLREGDDGPRVHYRLRNGGGTDATVAVRTVLAVEAGGTYGVTASADVPAGGEVVLEQRVVRYDALESAERERVRGGDAGFDVYVDGQLRQEASEGGGPR